MPSKFKVGDQVNVVEGSELWDRIVLECNQDPDEIRERVYHVLDVYSNRVECQNASLGYISADTYFTTEPENLKLVESEENSVSDDQEG